MLDLIEAREYAQMLFNNENDNSDLSLTIAFASLKIHKAYTQKGYAVYTPRDDFESLLFTLLWTITPRQLPWQARNMNEADALACKEQFIMTQDIWDNWLRENTFRNTSQKLKDLASEWREQLYFPNVLELPLPELHTTEDEEEIEDENDE